MNLIYKFRAVVAILCTAMLAVACEPTEDGGATTLGEAFTLSVTGSTKVDLAVDVTVTNDAVENYAVGIISKISYANTYKSDVAKAAAGVVDLISDKVDFSTVDNKYIFSGDQTADLANNWDLEQGTSYVIFAFGIDATGAITTDIATTAVSTSRESMYSTLTDIVFINELNPNQGEDWVELYNSGREEIDLSGFILYNAEGQDDDSAVTIPAGTTLKVGDYVVVGMNVSANGDNITLLDTKSKIVDEISTPIIGTTSSYGRSTDGSKIWKEFRSVDSTKGSANGMLDTGGVAPFTLSTEYVTNDRIVFKAVPHSNVGNYTYGCYPTATINDAVNGYGGDLNWFMDDICEYQREFGFPISEVDNLVVFNGNSFISCSDQWMIWTNYEQPFPDHTVVVCGIDEKGFRNTPPVSFEVEAVGEYEKDNSAYDKWLGAWTIESTSSYGSDAQFPVPITFDVVIDNNIPNMDYYMTGFEISMLNTDSRKVFFNASEGSLYMAPQSTCQYNSPSDPDNWTRKSGKFLYGAVDAETQDAPMAIRGDFIAMEAKLSDDYNATMKGNYYEDSKTGTTYHISCMNTFLYIYETDQHQPINADGNTYIAGKYPIGPYTMTRRTEPTSPSSLMPRVSRELPGRIFQSKYNFFERAMDCDVMPSNN